MKGHEGEALKTNIGFLFDFYTTPALGENMKGLSISARSVDLPRASQQLPHYPPPPPLMPPVLRHVLFTYLFVPSPPTTYFLSQPLKLILF